ncbi:hypothetical protein AWZ03_009586 [Drosophila navojoa]|uniref:Uncharacterized protein n=1 Tax=Drosophila navojoa TaxID=7232 RepID=A0A484B5S4_DRONA|nr:hypothetical protein AWZ03_009586 [Drosophila navojoa]
MGDGSDGKDLNEKRATNAGHARRSPDDGKAAKLKFSKTHNGEKQRQLNLKFSFLNAARVIFNEQATTRRRTVCL